MKEEKKEWQKIKIKIYNYTAIEENWTNIFMKKTEPKIEL